MRHPILLAMAGMLMAGLTFALGPYDELIAQIPASSLLEQNPSGHLNTSATMLAELSPAARRLYARHLGWDLLAIAGNTMILLALLVPAARRLSPAIGRAALGLAVLPAAFDTVENALTAILLSQGTTPASSVLQLTHGVVFGKFAAFGLALFSALIIWCLIAQRRFLRRGATPQAMTRG